jgi:hypothetical protein
VRRIIGAVIAVILVAAGFAGVVTPVSPAEAQVSVDTYTHNCSNVPGNDAPWITTLLETHNVVLTSWCLIDWIVPKDNPGAIRRVGIEIPNNRTLTIAAGAAVILEAGQTTSGTKLADIIDTRDQNAPHDIQVNGAGSNSIIEGQANTHGPLDDGTGFDGIQFNNCTNCTVSSMTIRNIRGKDASGTNESFGIAFDGCVSGCTATNVRVESTAGQKDYTSSGIAVNRGKNVVLTGNQLVGLGGRGTGGWYTTGLIIDGGYADSNSNHGIGLENSTGTIIRNGTWSVNNSVNGLQIRSTSGTRATGMVFAGNGVASVGLRRVPGESVCTDNSVSGSSSDAQIVHDYDNGNGCDPISGTIT